jgi:hypothetical protein
MITIKKNIDLELTLAEKQLLKTKGISQKSMSNFAIDEIATIIHASPQRAKMLQALFEFQNIPSIGIKFAKDLMLLGYYNLTSLKDKSAPELLNAYEKAIGYRVDPCVEDQFRLTVHYANHQDSTKKWWDFTAERKAFRNKYGYPDNRPL